MKNLIIFLSIISFNLGLSQSNFGQREMDILQKISEREEMKSQEQFNLDLIIQLYESVNDIQALRKYHYENRYNKEYLKRYERKAFYGLREERNWSKDEETMTRGLNSAIQLYNEQWQRCNLNYSWSRKFPQNISKEFNVNKLPY